MPESRKAITPERVYEVLERHAGNKTAMARELGVHRATVRALMEDYGIGDKPVTGGYIKPEAINKLPLPPEGEVYRYVLTSAQNNTKVFNAFFRNLQAYVASFTLQSKRCALFVSRFTYNKSAYENSKNHPSKPGRGPTDSDHADLWYHPVLDPYICDDPDRHGSCRYQLAPDLQWCAESNILPTRENPLSALDAYAGTSSAIFPHAKVMMRSVPRMPTDLPRFIYTTGTCTQMNYIQRSAGQKAEFHHVYGAIIVEVNSKGDWWARQINAGADGSFYDCPEGNVLQVINGQVLQLDGDGNYCEAINWGDIHAVEIDQEVARANWGLVDLDNEKSCDGVIDSLRPKHQLMNDVFSMQAQNHHDRDKFGRRYEKWVKGQDIVKLELDITAQVLYLAGRPFCKTAVVCSNHDRHGDRWLDEGNFKADLPNAKWYLCAQLSRVLATEYNHKNCESELDAKLMQALKVRPERGWAFFSWSMRHRPELKDLKFIELDESYLIGPRGHQVECGLHGDLGPNGSKGSNRALTRLGRRNNKGHDHSAAIYEGTYSAGVCQLDMDYAKGPTTWSISHILTYLNGKRTLLTQRAGKLWA